MTESLWRGLEERISSVVLQLYKIKEVTGIVVTLTKQRNTHQTEGVRSYIRGLLDPKTDRTGMTELYHHPTDRVSSMSY